MEVVKALFKWIKNQKTDETQTPFKLMDLDRVVVAGHSRGGWLSALLVSGEHITNINIHDLPCIVKVPEAPHLEL